MHSALLMKPFAEAISCLALGACLSCVAAPLRTSTFLPEPSANEAFVSGLNHLYGFNYAAAESAFRRASELAPTSPLPQWGLAMALGPNTNDPEITGERMRDAYSASQRALALSKGSSSKTQALANAVVSRYTNSATYDVAALNAAYSAAMRAAWQASPEGADLATLFVESLMLARKGAAWTQDGRPHPATEEGLHILEGILARNPMHLGASHYHLHLLDSSPTPERGLVTARRLEKIGDGAGHLLHMPSHVYMRVGDYRAAVATNRRAVAADRAHGPGHGVYEVLQIHSREYLAAAASMTGQYKLAWDADPSLFVLMRFSRWSDILARPVPDGGVSELELRIGRVLAFAGHGDLESAKKAFADYERTEQSLPSSERRWWGQPIEPFLQMVRHEMLARILWLQGDRRAAISSWYLALSAQDTLTRAEGLLPWFHPIRESLGAALVADHQHAAAEAVFRDDLRLHPNNPRALFGLMNALVNQGKASEAETVRKLFEDGWRDADVVLKMDDL